MTGTASSVEQGSFEEKASSYSWKCIAQEGLPNVLIIGDSISIGYTLQVREFLKDKANVYRPVDGKENPINCGDSSKGVQELKNWLGDTQWDLIHFNWGLHDLKRVAMTSGKQVSNPSLPPRLSLDRYRGNLKACLELLKQSSAKLVFATTTAYPEGVKPCRLPEDAPKYNKVAKEVMNEQSIVINDLYDLTKDRLKELQIPKNVHFTDVGSAVIAKQLATVIAEQLGIKHLTLPKYNSSKEAFDEGKKLSASKKLEPAIEAYLFAAALGRSSAAKTRALLKAGFLLSRIKKLDESTRVLKNVLSLPGNSEASQMAAYLGLAKNAHQEGDQGLAQEYFSKVGSLGEIPLNLKRLYSVVQSSLELKAKEIY